jgi:hypothetical protein
MMSSSLLGISGTTPGRQGRAAGTRIRTRDWELPGSKATKRRLDVQHLLPNSGPTEVEGKRGPDTQQARAFRPNAGIELEAKTKPPGWAPLDRGGLWRTLDEHLPITCGPCPRSPGDTPLWRCDRGSYRSPSLDQARSCRAAGRGPRNQPGSEGTSEPAGGETVTGTQTQPALA